MSRWWRMFCHACGFDEHRCIACLRPFDRASGVRPGTPAALCCSSCRALLPVYAGCVLCGLPLPDPAPAASICGACRLQPPPWQRLHVLGVHQGLLRDLLLRGKFGADVAVCHALGHMLAAQFLHNGETGDVRSDESGQAGALRALTALVPMPLHPSRLRERGFNQCYEIAAPISAKLHIPIRTDLALRVLVTPSQTGLHRRDRLRNLKRAFAASPAVAGQHLLLVDDTLTTGTTLRRLSACLLDAGAATVEVAVVAIALPHRQGGILLPVSHQS